ncbi:ABC transporter substrate-binding protein [Cohnella sp. CIP 111063]|uniref:extracellular solute-binding protein n=1 Tax=unclassified Cohnella TaxID=2636738 RepID=UPI000B8BBEEB|nr:MULTISPECIES: extracellular solute-binding protein [unclassified Cohnella]OXS56499.1 ABC transporter substrate-binding protein [Cohnella sp. CIP 111063]PRX68676.1 putative aldouronate transport system substrate-binding protein [Cohnella sp. SGD-V74]
MKRVNKSLYGLLALTLALTLVLAACSSNNEGSGNGGQASSAPPASESSASPAESKAPEGDGTPRGKVKPVTFTQYVHYDWYTAPTWEERPHGQWITENLGVVMEPIQSNGAAANKLNTMIVSNQLPDAIVLDRGKDVDRLVSAGKLVALDPYLEKYPEFAQTIGEETLNMLRSEDGKLYQVPNWFINGDQGNGNAAYLINRKIHKELGSPQLETWSQLEDYLRQVKEKYPDVVPIDFGEVRDGESQLFGLLYSGSADGRTPMFVGNGVPQDDKFQSIYEDQGFVDTALFASRLFRDGLTSKDAFTQTRDQVLEKLNNGKIAVFGAFDAVVEGIGREANNILRAADPEAGYDVIWPFHQDGVDKNKVYPGGYNTLGWNVNVITTNAKDPEAIFAYMNWAISEEGQQIFFFGPPGLFYDEVVDGVPVPNDAYKNRDPKAYDELKIGEFNWYGNTVYVDTTKAKREQLLPEEAQDWTTIAQYTVSFQTTRNVTEFSNLDPAPDSDEGIIQQRFKDHQKQIISKIVFASNDAAVLNIIEGAKTEAEKLQYQKLLDWKTAKWQDNLKIMGLK